METIWIIRRLFSAQGMQESCSFSSHRQSHGHIWLPMTYFLYLGQMLQWEIKAFYTWPLSPSKGWLRCAGLCYQPTKNLPLPFFHVRGGNIMPTQLTSPSPPLKLRELWRWETFQERNTIRLFEMELLGNQSVSASSGVYSCYLTCFCTPSSAGDKERRAAFTSCFNLSQSMSPQSYLYTGSRRRWPQATSSTLPLMLHASFDKLCFFPVVTCVLCAEWVSECMYVLPSMSLSVVYPNPENVCFTSEGEWQDNNRQRSRPVHRTRSVSVLKLLLFHSVKSEKTATAKHSSKTLE